MSLSYQESLFWTAKMTTYRVETVEEALVRGLKIKIIPPIGADVGRFLLELQDLEDMLNIDADNDVYHEEVN